MATALITAAGRSSRMGRSKALLQYRGRTFLETIVMTIRAAAIERIMVAISMSDDKINDILDLTYSLNVEVVYNVDDASAGPLGSIRAGISEIVNYSVEYMAVWPVDQPHVALETMQGLQAAFGDHRHAIVVPTFRGRRGHPVLFGREVFHELLAAPPDQGARSVVRRLPDRVLSVPVSDPAVLEDIDTPEDYQRLISSTRSLL